MTVQGHIMTLKDKTLFKQLIYWFYNIEYYLHCFKGQQSIFIIKKQFIKNFEVQVTLGGTG